MTMQIDQNYCNQQLLRAIETEIAIKLLIEKRYFT